MASGGEGTRIVLTIIIVIELLCLSKVRVSIDCWSALVGLSKQIRVAPRCAPKMLLADITNADAMLNAKFRPNTGHPVTLMSVSAQPPIRNLVRKQKKESWLSRQQRAVGHRSVVKEIQHRLCEPSSLASCRHKIAACAYRPSLEHLVLGCGQASYRCRVRRLARKAPPSSRTFRPSSPFLATSWKCCCGLVAIVMAFSMQHVMKKWMMRYTCAMLAESTRRPGRKSMVVVDFDGMQAFPAREAFADESAPG
jgi:hypothetical protein